VKTKTRNLRNVLIIQMGPLGEFMQALAAAKTIREYHYDGRITLLTRPEYAALGRLCPYFDVVWENDFATNLWSKLGLVRQIHKAKLGRIYDLQTSSKSNSYFKLFGPLRPEWVGTAKGCSHPHKNKKRLKMHIVDRQAEQLAMAGVGLGRGRVGGTALPPNLDWVKEVQKSAARTELTWFGVRRPYALLAPGSAPQSIGKRWPAEYYGDLAMLLRRSGIMPVILGTDSEKELVYSIHAACPSALSLINRTDLIQLIILARQARLAVGNDTGPMHIIAAANCPSVVLFSSESEPEICAPRGKDVTILQRKRLTDLGISEVCEVLQTKDLIDMNKYPMSPPHMAN
jgi:ADP-heptose:LPS heptosyltransferase